LGLKFAKDVQQLNDELNPYRRLDPGQPPCPAANVGQCNLKGDTATPLDDSDLKKQRSLLDQGHTAQTREIVFLSVAGAFAIAGGYFLYRGYLDAGSETNTASRGLRIFPTASASAGGIVTEFDF
jgi:hypothetical protein